MRRSEQLVLVDDIPARPVGPWVTSVAAAPTNAEMIERIAPLYLTGSVLDATWGEGMWWRRHRPDGLVGCDIDPTVAADVRADARCLPFLDDCFDTVVFDPPYVPAGGADSPTWAGTARSGGLKARFGIQSTSKAAISGLMERGLAETARVARTWVLVKCGDYMDDKRFHFGLDAVFTAAAPLSLEPWDLIVHASGSKFTLNVAEQVRTRRAHSYLVVYRKAGQ